MSNEKIEIEKVDSVRAFLYKDMEFLENIMKNYIGGQIPTLVAGILNDIRMASQIIQNAGLDEHSLIKMADDLERRASKHLHGLHRVLGGISSEIKKDLKGGR